MPVTRGVRILLAPPIKQVNAEMMAELRSIKAAVRPSDTLLVGGWVARIAGGGGPMDGPMVGPRGMVGL